MRTFVRKWLKRLGVLLLALMLLNIAAIPFLVPSLAALACPSCYGLQRLDRGLYVESAMSPFLRQKLQGDIASARQKVALFYGRPFAHSVTLLVCASASCDSKLGGKGAKAVTYTTFGLSFIRVAPAGANATILAHEFSHVELHAQIGATNYLRGVLPAWFDEGLAVVVANDQRFMNHKLFQLQNCFVQRRDGLPAKRRQWARLAGRSPLVYAKAACKVSRWMAKNGGRAGLAKAIKQMASGQFPAFDR